MAGDRVKYERALKKWDTLREQRQFSVPSDLGSTAILYSLRRASIHDIEQDHQRAIEDFRDEAHDVASEIRAVGLRATVFSGINHQSVGMVMDDRRYSSIVMIGYGSFSGVNLDKSGALEWWHIASMTSHLKTGLFVQRFCGHYVRPLAVPLGAFAVDDHRNVLAPPGRFFDPVLDPRDESLLRPVTRRRRMTCEDIRRSFTVDSLDIDDEEVSSP